MLDYIVSVTYVTTTANLGVDLVPSNHNIKTRRTQNSQIKQRFENTILNLFTGNIQGTRRHRKVEKNKQKKKNKNSHT